MKVLLDIKDNKAHHLMEVLKGLSYVKAKTLNLIKLKYSRTLKKQWRS